MKGISKKQLDYIKDMEDVTGIKFKGTTVEDAKQYIDQNKPKYHLILNSWATQNGYF